jgi:type VI secretion system secreted protein Hcp
MAFDGYIDFGSDVPGEVPDEHRNKKQIKMLDYRFGVSNSVNMGSANQRASAGAANQEVFRFVKQIDKATPKLYVFCCKPKQDTGFDKVTVSIYKAATETTPYLKFEFSNVFIASVCEDLKGATYGAPTPDVPTEVVELAYDKVKVTYALPDGSTAAEQTLDFANNKFT